MLGSPTEFMRVFCDTWL